eukprot:TRINITY_DN110197_c0_g1_i1.p1 TRINITY_DN110197_c0_g1~~TRINITY_DN110197_c0_g1_i1.p1  ORF type:complete len:444 (+),score=53.38 TRINITY_DN110197_c0_g1_i1:120-1451(+)
MIIYDDGSWLRIILQKTGSVWPTIWPMMVAWVLTVVGTYLLLDTQDLTFGTDEHSMLGGTMSFLLVFRANQAYTRYWEGRTAISHFFSDMRNFLLFVNLYVRGGVRNVNWDNGNRSGFKNDENDMLAREVRVTATRLSIAFAVLLKSHTRLQLDGYCFGEITKDVKWDLDWDRLRLRQLLNDFEFRMVDSHLGILGRPNASKIDDLVAQFHSCYEEGPPDTWPDVFKIQTRPDARPHLAISYFLRELLMDNLNDAFNLQPHGIKERFVPLLSILIKNSLQSFEHISVIMSVPLPLPYAALCKLLLTTWMATFPFVQDPELGPFGGMFIPIVIVLALLGLDAISTELENPFGEDSNDLDVLEQIANLETEAMGLLEMAGDYQAADRFVWRRLPQRIAASSCKPVRRQLVCADYAVPEFVTATGSTPRLPRPIRVSPRAGSHSHR